MAKLKTQPSALPTRKVLAVAIAGALTSVASMLADQFLPGMGIGMLVKQYEVEILALVMTAAGYLTKDRA